MPSTQRWDAGSDVVRILGAPETRTGFVRLDLLGPNAGLFFLFGDEVLEKIGPHWTFGRVDACPSVIEYPPPAMAAGPWACSSVRESTACKHNAEAVGSRPARSTQHISTASSSASVERLSEAQEAIGSIPISPASAPEAFREARGVGTTSA